jgi:hypothetical protein
MWWDEQERCARAVLRFLGGLIAAVEVAILALGLYAGSLDIFLGSLTFLCFLGGAVLAYAIIVGGLTHALAGLVRLARMALQVIRPGAGRSSSPIR